MTVTPAMHAPCPKAQGFSPASSPGQLWQSLADLQSPSNWLRKSSVFRYLSAEKGAQPAGGLLITQITVWHIKWWRKLCLFMKGDGSFELRDTTKHCHCRNIIKCFSAHFDKWYNNYMTAHGLKPQMSPCVLLYTLNALILLVVGLKGIVIRGNGNFRWHCC